MTGRPNSPRAPWHAPLTRRLGRMSPGAATLATLAIALGSLSGGWRHVETSVSARVAGVANAVDSGGGQHRDEHRGGELDSDVGDR
jgi:hypothetical protein